MTKHVQPRGFFAYPSLPVSAGEAIRAALERLNYEQIVTVQSWEALRIGGKVIIAEILKNINNCAFLCADLTGLNPNVLFELGYGIAIGKPVWIVLDTTYAEYRKAFEQLRMLTTVGYRPYTNSSDIVGQLYQDQPYAEPDSLLERVITPELHPSARAEILYLKDRHATETSVRVTRRLDKSGLPLVIDDPNESSVQSLSWYASKIYSSMGVVCHLTHPNRDGASLHNARYAFVAGMTVGLGKPLLMLADRTDLLAPLDYRDLLKQHSTATEAIAQLEQWLHPIQEQWTESRKAQQEYASTIKLATELSGLQLGEYVAENEEDRLSEYFVDTSAYHEALRGSHTIFVGRKGSGKTSDLIQLAATLSADVRNIVCVIKPIAYELEGIVELLRRFRGLDTKGYAIESLWKFLLTTEVANATVTSIEHKLPSTWTSEERELVELLNRDGAVLREEFTVRMERSVNDLLQNESAVPARDAGLARTSISETLHAGPLSELRKALAKVLTRKSKVTVLVDNLDKAWDRRDDLSELSEFLLGLLNVADRVGAEFRSGDRNSPKVNLVLAIFLRSDIFFKVVQLAREPDKIPFFKLVWSDPQLLIRVIEERFVASHEGGVQPQEMWDRYFCPQVRGVPTKSYFTSQILPRPRDIVYFVKASIALAVNRRHPIVQEDDIIDAERQYSQYAIESILVEDSNTRDQLEEILYEFAGGSSVRVLQEVEHAVRSVITDGREKDGVIDQLCMLSFLGIEVKADDFRFTDDPKEYRLNQVLARKLALASQAPMRFKVHPAFCAFLEIEK
jgi:hypothetical protein